MRQTLVIAVLTAAVTTGCMKDIRPDGLQAVQTPAGESEQRGRALLRAAAEAHGVASFSTHQTYEMEVVDHWKGLLGRLGNPWPDTTVHAVLAYRTNSADGRARFLDGKKEGWTWGLQSWHAYRVRPDGETEFKKNKDLSFILPAIQYLTEFPFRDHSNKVVAYAGPETIDGVEYERVYVTWTSMEPTTRHDQYVAYIDPSTMLVCKLHYTIRQFARFAQATMHFEDYQTVDGIKVAMKQSVTSKHTDDPDEYVHRITVKQVSFGTPAAGEFVVDDKLGKDEVASAVAQERAKAL